MSIISAMTKQASAARDEAIFHERIAGNILKEVAQRHKLSIETVRQIADREGRRHMEALVLQLWLAQKQGEYLGLAVPAGLAEDERNVHSYFEWVLGHLPEYGVEPRVHYRPGIDGSFLFALEDASFHPNPVVKETE